MAVFWITVPLMIVGLAIAVLPLLITIRRTSENVPAREATTVPAAERVALEAEGMLRRAATRQGAEPVRRAS